MKIGVPKEIKNNEYRVALTPSSVKTLSDQSHDIYIQSGAGDAIGFTDNDYIKSGATILAVSYTHLTLPTTPYV